MFSLILNSDANVMQDESISVAKNTKESPYLTKTASKPETADIIR